jgi:N-acetyl-anhydromuramyl-L-alanine amidase AmpD
METEGSRKRPWVPTWALVWALAAIVCAPAPAAHAWPSLAHAATAPKPPISEDRISYGAERKAQMAAYSHRHYGEREFRLVDPQVIVLHFTATDSYDAVWSTFDSNATNMGESPGVCSHYVIEQNGTIDELVPPRTRCRHAIGLNHVAIGIEMVQSAGPGSHWADQQILERRPQIGAALRLVRWLQARYGIPTGEVIGHSMANDDPHFKDLEGWVNDHTDWLKRDVREFRQRLKRLGS